MKRLALILFFLSITALLFGNTLIVHSGEDLAGALKQAKDGDIVFVYRGKYDACASLNKDLTIMGAEEGVILYCSKKAEAVFKITKANVSIENVKLIVQGDIGMAAFNSKISLENVDISIKDSGIGIMFSGGELYGDKLKVHGTKGSYTGRGIYLGGQGIAVIKELEASYMKRGIVTEAKRVLILQGDIYDNEYGVVVIDGDVTVALSKFQTNLNGLLVSGKSQIEIVANKFEGNGNDILYNQKYYKFDDKYEIQPFNGEVIRIGK